MPIELKVPEVGESISEVFIGEWFKAEGDHVEKDEPLVEVETDKATLEVPASVSGVLSKVLKKQGDTAEVGEIIAHIEEGASSNDASSAPKSQESAEKAKPEAEPAQTASATPSDKIMPAAQRLLEENNLRAEQVPATGPKGNLLKEDVERYLEQQSTSAAASPASSREAPSREAPQPVGQRHEEAVPMSPLRRKIAERLVQAQQTAALLTTFNEIDMSEAMALRKEYKDMFEEKYGVRLGFMSLFVKAAIDALKTIPQINAEIRGNDIVYHNYYDIGVAVSSKKGLVVPVIRNAERLSFADIERTIGDFGKRAQSNKLAPEELQGGTFTISNGGVFGSLMSTPIVNPPQSGVLGMHSIQQRPIAVNGQVVIRPMMYVALTYDHRIVDGREAVTFLKRIKEAIERPARMLLEV